MLVSLNGFNEQTATFAVYNNVAVDDLVKVSFNQIVGKCSANDNFMGQILSVNGSYAAVKLYGYVNVSYTGSTEPTLGFCKLTANGSGGVTAAATGREYLVTDIDSAGKKIGFILL